MAHLQKTVSIDAPPDSVWAVLGDLAATSEWLPGTVSARMEGTVRVCRTAGGGEVREEITEYSAEDRRYRYRHLQTRLPVARSTGTFSVEAGEGGGSVVVLDAEFDALEPERETEIERMFGDALDQALESLRRRVDQDVTWQVA
ncbi:MAG TPA: SRPBCC family protein [Gaiellaceae bacterium]|nr:SRPBCC family protein [Gaiellaceae bacterium]